MMGQPVGGRQALAHIVDQGGEAHGAVGGQAGGGVHHHHGVGTDVALGMVLDRLRHAEQRVQFGQQPGQRPTLAQGLEEPAGAVAAECLVQFQPHPFRGDGVERSRRCQLGHQRQRLGRDGEAIQLGGEAGGAQDTDRVIGEAGNVAQHAGLQVGPATERIDQGTVLTHRHGVDGQVAGGEIVLDGGAARQGVFLARHGVQEDGKVLADLLEATRQQVGGRGADNHSVVVADGAAQQLVADAAADEVELHVVSTGGGRSSKAVRALAASATSSTGAICRCCARASTCSLCQSWPDGHVSIHAPARGTTRHASITRRLRAIVSIHAPARGTTAGHGYGSLSRALFQSTPPRGGRR